MDIFRDGVKYYVCAVCLQMFSKIDSIRNHKKYYGTKETCGVDHYRKSLPLFEGGVSQINDRTYCSFSSTQEAVKSLSSCSYGKVSGKDNHDIDNHYSSRVGNGFKSLHFFEAKTSIDPTVLRSCLDVLDHIPPLLIEKCQDFGSLINSAVKNNSSLYLRDAIANSGETSPEKKLHFESVSNHSIVKYGRRLAKFIWFLVTLIDDDYKNLLRQVNLNENLVSALLALKNTLPSTSNEELGVSSSMNTDVYSTDSEIDDEEESNCITNDNDLLLFFSQSSNEADKNASVEESSDSAAEKKSPLVSDTALMLSPELQAVFEVMMCVVTVRMNLSTPQLQNSAYLYVFFCVLEKDPSEGFKGNYSSIIESVYVSYNFFLRGTVMLNLLQKQKNEGNNLSATEENNLISLGTRGTSEGLTVLSTFAMCNHTAKRDGESRLPKLQASKYTEEQGVVITYQGQTISQKELNESVHYLNNAILDVYYELLPKSFISKLPGLDVMVDLETGVGVNQSYVDREENKRSLFVREALRILLPSDKFGQFDLCEGGGDEGLRLKLPNVEACLVMNSFIKTFSKLPRMIATLFSIVCSPLRAPETVSLTYRDCLGVSRDVYVYMGKLAFFFKALKPSGMKRSSQILLRFCIDEVGHVFHLYLYMFRGLYEIARRSIITLQDNFLYSSGATLTESMASDLSYRFFINETGASLTPFLLRHWVTEFLQERILGFRLGRFSFSDRRTIFQAMINFFLKFDGKLTSLLRSFDENEPLVKSFVKDCGHSSSAAHEGYLQTSASNFLGFNLQISGQSADLAMARQQVFSLFHCFLSWKVVPPGGTNFLASINSLSTVGGASCHERDHVVDPIRKPTNSKDFEVLETRSSAKDSFESCEETLSSVSESIVLSQSQGTVCSYDDSASGNSFGDGGLDSLEITGSSSAADAILVGTTLVRGKSDTVPIRQKRCPDDYNNSNISNTRKKVKLSNSSSSSFIDELFDESFCNYAAASNNDKRTCGDVATCNKALSEWVNVLQNNSKHDLYKTLFLILSMGGGKGSLIVNLGKMARRKNQMLIVIASLNAIKWDLKRRLDQAGVTSKVYRKEDRKSDLFKYLPSVLILTAETVVELLRSCSESVEQLIKGGLLFQVVIDEVDSFVVDQIYRSSFRDFLEIFDLFRDASLVLLSGTVREDEEENLLRAFGVENGSGILTIRQENTQRPCIQLGISMYNASEVGDGNINPKHEAMIDFIFNCLLEIKGVDGSSNAKVMIFVDSQASVEEAEKVLPTIIVKRRAEGIIEGIGLVDDNESGVFIHSGMSEERKCQAFKRMSTDKKVRFCVCTTIWSRGVNFANVVGVLQAYLCYDGMTVMQSFGRGCRFPTHIPCKCVQLLPISVEESSKQLENRKIALASKDIKDSYVRLILTNRLERYEELILSFYNGSSEEDCYRKMYSGLVDAVTMSCEELLEIDPSTLNCDRCCALRTKIDLNSAVNNSINSNNNSFTIKTNAQHVRATSALVVSSNGNHCSSPLMPSVGVGRSFVMKQRKNLASYLLNVEVVDPPDSLTANEKWSMQNKLFFLLQDKFKLLNGNCLNCFFNCNNKISKCERPNPEFLCDKCTAMMKKQRACFFCYSSEHAKSACLKFHTFASIKNGFSRKRTCFSCLLSIDAFPVTMNSNKFHKWNGQRSTNIGPNCNCIGRGIVENLVFRYLMNNDYFITEFILSYGVRMTSSDCSSKLIEFLGNEVAPYNCIGAVVCFLHFCINY